MTILPGFRLSRIGHLRVVVGLMALAASAACTNGALKPGDGGVPDSAAMAQSDAANVAPAMDAPADVFSPPVTGRRSYVVRSTITLLQDGGMSALVHPPATYIFTLVLDADARTALVGSADRLTAVTVRSTDGRTFHVNEPFNFNFKTGCGASLSYNDVTFTATDSGLSGSGQGQATNIGGDVIFTAGVSMSLTGQPDTEPPSFVVPTDVDPTDPFLPFGLAASEPLPLDANPTLLSDSGDTVVLVPPSPTFIPGALSTFLKPNVILRYGETYRMDVSGVMDFAGNVATAAAALRFTTRAIPPLVPEDGFESATGATLGGAQILTVASAPIITGGKSVYVPISSSFSPPPPGTQMALRLALQPGDQVIRFSYRTVHPSATIYPIGLSLSLGSVGGPVTGATLTPNAGPATPFQMPDQTTVYLGPTTAAEIPVPAGATTEVIVARISSAGSCGFPSPPIPGLIIDDLRAE